MGSQISLSTSRHLPPGLYIPPNAIAALIAEGWQPPTETQDPKGSFLLPTETP